MRRAVPAILSALFLACGPSPEPDAAPVGTDSAQAAVPADTLQLSILPEDPDCVPGACVCRGSAERSTGLWEVGLEDAELTAGVHCIAADFDGNGSVDLALLGVEGLMAVVMYRAGGPVEVFELDAAGYPALYEPREIDGPNGEPSSEHPGVFVPNVGREHAVFLWDGSSFARTRWPAS